MLQAGLEGELVTQQDKHIGKAILIGVPLLVLAANWMAINQHPKAIPLQAALDQILPLSAQVNAGIVDVDTLKAEYRIPERAMTFLVKVNNRSDKPVQVGELAVANVRFLNKEFAQPSQDNTDRMIAPDGLTLSDATPIQPGEERTMTIIAKDALWESERLDGLIRDSDSRIGGLLFFYDGLVGERFISSITAAVIPKFN
jgi:methane/ammonia monooxygenase subunit B